MKKTILDEHGSYTFSDYFNLSNPAKEIVAELGYKLRLEKLSFPQKEVGPLKLDRLRETFYRKLPHVSLHSEAAKREFLISPLLLELLDYLDLEIDLEYPLAISNKLNGNIDYVIHSANHLIVIEAKNADLEKGFTQLAVELIAMDNYVEEDQESVLYGAVTVGEVWRFGSLYRREKLILKDIDVIAIPADLEKLFTVFLKILG